MSKTKLLKNASKGYSYNYVSLADIVLQGHELPKMRVRPIDGIDYVEYYDTETQTWNIGSKVVVPDMKGSNAAQCYGAGLSYARRYSALMALQLASSDDDPVELDVTNIEETLSQALTIDQLTNIYATIPERYKSFLRGAFAKRKEELTSTHDAIVKVNRNA